MIPITREWFEFNFEAPWKIDGAYLDDVESLYHLYIGKMINTNDLKEMVDVIQQFKFLTLDAKQCLADRIWERAVREYQTGLRADLHATIKNLLINRKNVVGGIEIEKYAPLICPYIMLRATMIANEYIIPEYYAALQYCRANWFGDEDAIEA